MTLKLHKLETSKFRCMLEHLSFNITKATLEFILLYSRNMDFVQSGQVSWILGVFFGQIEKPSPAELDFSLLS